MLSVDGRQVNEGSGIGRGGTESIGAKSPLHSKPLNERNGLFALDDVLLLIYLLCRRRPQR
jgi:hypothetical protein